MTNFTGNKCLLHDCQYQGKLWGVIDRGTEFEIKLRYCKRHLGSLRFFLNGFINNDLNNKKSTREAEKILKATNKSYKKHLHKIIVEARKNKLKQKINKYEQRLRRIELGGKNDK